jgi:hypothetical protein
MTPQHTADADRENFMTPIAKIVNNGTTLPLKKATARAEKIAAKLVFPPHLIASALANNPSGFGFPADDVIRGSLCGENSPLRNLDGRAFLIEDIRTAEQNLDLNNIFSEYLHTAEIYNLEFPWTLRSDESRTVLASRRPAANAAEGLFSFKHDISLQMEGESFWLGYHIELENIFVIPPARGSGVAHSLIACLIEGFRDDVRFLHKKIVDGNDRMLNEVRIGFSVGGDIMSEGGRAVAEIVENVMQEVIEDEFSDSEIKEFMVDRQALDADFEDIQVMDSIRAAVSSASVGL